MASEEGAVEAWEEALKDTSRVLEGMVTAVREAGDAALDLQRTGLSRQEKGGHHDIVTEGDIASQRIAMTNLGSRHSTGCGQRRCLHGREGLPGARPRGWYDELRLWRPGLGGRCRSGSRHGPYTWRYLPAWKRNRDPSRKGARLQGQRGDHTAQGRPGHEGVPRGGGDWAVRAGRSVATPPTAGAPLHGYPQPFLEHGEHGRYPVWCSWGMGSSERRICVGLRGGCPRSRGGWRVCV